MKKSVGLLAAAFLAAFTGAAQAHVQPTDLISAAVGYYDVDQNEPRNKAADFRLEYRSGYDLFGPGINRYVSIRPMFGAEMTSDAGFYGFGGLLFDVALTDHLYFTPNFAVGAYFQGDGKDLGSTVEFRSTAEVAYRFDDQSRLGVSFGHISNAGITKLNPGVEILSLYYHMPLSYFSGKGH